MKKKRIRLGEPFMVWAFCGFMLLLLFLATIFSTDATLESRLSFYGVYIPSCIIGLLLMSLDENFGSFIILEKDTIYVKKFFRRFQEYSKQHLSIKYGVKKIETRSGLHFVPCLMIGETTTNLFYFAKETTGSRKLIYENYYFLMILNKKRLSTLANWWQKEIELPNKEEWKEFCAEWKKVHMHGVKEVEKFYEMIEDYNNPIKAVNNSQD